MLTQNDVLELLYMYDYGTPKEKAWARTLLKEWVEEKKAEKIKKKINVTGAGELK